MESPPKVSPPLETGVAAVDAHPAEASAQAGRGRHARTPTEIPVRGWRDILARTFQQLGEDNLSIVAAGIAFYAFTATVPALAAIIAVYALVADPGTVTTHIEAMARVLPEQAKPLLNDQLKRLTSDSAAAGWGAALGIGIALFSSMKAMTALITGLNIAYDEMERRGIVKLYLTAFLLTLAGVVGAVAVIGLLAVTPYVLRVSGAGEGGVGRVVFMLLAWPLLAGLFMGAVAIVYRHAPCRAKPQWRWVSWGAGVATGLWLLGSVGFSYYVSGFGDYEGTYGSLGAVVVFLTWLFLTAYVMLLGAELDSEMERQTLKDTTTGAEKPLGQRGAHAADTVGRAAGGK